MNFQMRKEGGRASVPARRFTRGPRPRAPRAARKPSGPRGGSAQARAGLALLSSPC